MKLNEGVSIDTLGTGIMRRLTNHSGQYFDRSLKWAIQCSEFPCEPVLKSKVRNHSYEHDFDLHENETACRTHFHMKGFALRLVLKQSHKRTRKWPIDMVLQAITSLH